MNPRLLGAAALIAHLLTPGTALAADPTQYLPSTLPGYARAQVKCMSCHNAESMASQPPAAPRAHWESMVKRMKRVFKARLDDADIADIVDYLAKTYGNEAEGQASAPKDPAKEVPAIDTPKATLSATSTLKPDVPPKPEVLQKPETPAELPPVNPGAFPMRRR